MKKTVWMLTLLGTLLLTGCSPTVIVNGVSYQALKPEEERIMMDMARQSLLHQPKKFSAAELQLIRTTDPVFTVHYTGDRRGKATAVWQGKKRIISFCFTGEFMVNGKMGMYLDVTDNSNRVLNLAKEQQAKAERAKSGKKRNQR